MSSDEQPVGASAQGREPQPRATGGGDRVAETPVTVDTAQWFGGRREVRLLHRGQEYRLRVTKQGKLILTK